MADSAEQPLLVFTPGMDVGALEDWPWQDNSPSNYVLLDGTRPRASGRIHHATATTIQERAFGIVPGERWNVQNRAMNFVPF